jgi:polysaccharide export outer membrane protein
VVGRKEEMSCGAPEGALYKLKIFFIKFYHFITYKDMRKYVYYLMLASLLMATSCGTQKKSVYFSENSPAGSATFTQRMDKMKELNIQPDDILAIHVTTISSIAEKTPINIFNDGGTAYNVSETNANGGSFQTNGYLVDANGNIDFPVIGKVSVAGKTIRQVKETLATKLRDYIKDPVVEARIINYRVTVLGEVGRPGTVTAPNHRISVVEALAAAGDVMLTGRKDNILIVRETDGVREFARLNLNSTNVFSSPYYYLKQNDIVYVEPARIRRQQNSEFTQTYLPVISTVISTLLAVYGIVVLSK